MIAVDREFTNVTTLAPHLLLLFSTRTLAHECTMNRVPQTSHSLRLFLEHGQITTVGVPAHLQLLSSNLTMAMVITHGLLLRAICGLPHTVTDLGEVIMYRPSLLPQGLHLRLRLLYIMIATLLSSFNCPHRPPVVLTMDTDTGKYTTRGKILKTSQHSPL